MVTGIRYADEHLGQLLAVLERAGVLDDTAIIITADHGENQGELNYYGSHRIGDHVTHNVPMIIRWPGVTRPGSVFDGLCYHFDATATVLDLLGIKRPAQWDARPLTEALRGNPGAAGREYVVMSQLACMAQRSVRFGDWLLMRTWHDGFSGFPDLMLYNLRDDPHEQENLASVRPDVVGQGLMLLEQWHGEMMASQVGPDRSDPLETVLHEQPLHASPQHLIEYARRLRATGRAHLAAALESRQRPVGALPEHTIEVSVA